MKKIVILLLLTGIGFQVFSKPKSLRAYMSFAAFYSPVDGPYLETYLSVLGKSVNFVSTQNGKFQGTLLVTLLFKQNDSIRDFRKYELLSHEITDTANIDFMLFDQQRISLPNGKYILELQLADKNLDKPPFIAQDEVFVDYDNTKTAFSGIELLETYSKATDNSHLAKSGLEMIPYQDDFYPARENKMTFYAELYNVAKALGNETSFVIGYSIQSLETGKTVLDFERIKRETAREVNVVLSDFDISNLPSGNYYLVLSARDKNNTVFATRSLFFQRSNPALKFDDSSLASVVVDKSFVSKFQDDTIKEYIRCCFPIAASNEKLFIKNSLDMSNLLIRQQFFMNFWLQRNNADPEGAWNSYHQVVEAVNREFSTSTRKGYETDRGRIYLQYGAPNQRIVEHITPQSYPYEIWHYYKFQNQSNLKFVFYARDRSVNDHLLVHSTAYGEVKNVNWQYEVQRNIHPHDTEKERYTRAMEEDEFGEHTGEYYNLQK